MPKLPSVRPADAVRALERAGFSRVRQVGSHLRLERAGRGGQGSQKVTVPMHKGELKPGTLRSILRQAGLTAEEFLDLLR